MSALRSQIDQESVRSTRREWLILLFASCTGTGLEGASKAQLDQRSDGSKPTLLIIPHTHWEGAVFKTRGEYLDVGLANILKALSILRQNPEYRFVLDQVCYIKPFFERFPEEESIFRKLLSERRLQIAGATDAMNDNNMPSGESLVHQFLLGKSYFRKKLGYDVRTGWALDTFGHNAQMPQLLSLAGIESYWFQRGVSSSETASEFWWEGLDGTRIAAYWLPIGYGAFFKTPNDQVDFDALARERFAQLEPNTHGLERVLLSGGDVDDPDGDLPRKVRNFNSEANGPFSMRFATPAEFEAIVNKRKNRQVIKGELNPVFQGIYSTRIEVKQAIRELERLLNSAEKFSAIAECLLQFPPAKADLARAWEPVLFNQTHDLTSGVMVDKVYEDTMSGYDYARRLGTEILQRSVETLALGIDTRGEGIPVVAFNGLSWQRTDAVEVEIGISDADIHFLQLVDAANRELPIQIVRAEHNEDGGIRYARVAFVAHDVPALGWSLFRVIPKRAQGSPMAASPTQKNADASCGREDQGAIANEFFQARLNLWTGEMTSLIDLKDGWEALRESGNVVAREDDGGDFWELYGTLNGGRLTAMSRKITLPRAARTQWSSDSVGGNGRTQNNAVYSQYQVSHSLGKNDFSTTVRLYTGVRRVEITTEILNQEPFVRYRVLFPSTVRNGRNTQEIAFGAIERPFEQEFPAQNWIDYSDDQHGLAILNRGLPGSNVADGTLMISLLRSARLISYGFSGGYEPGVSSDTGLELGKRITLKYAVLPHSGDWRDGSVVQAGLSFNQPLIGVISSRHEGKLPARWGFLTVSETNVIVSALKPGEDNGIILRVYESSGRMTPHIRITFASPLESARETNIIEDDRREIGIKDNGIEFDLRAFEIKTFRLRFIGARTS
ncbi:MAG: alpha-mannosidase [Bryobacteraceae bacterium]